MIGSRVHHVSFPVSDLERAETQRYLQMFYGLQFRPLADCGPVEGHARLPCQP